MFSIQGQENAEYAHVNHLLPLHCMTVHSKAGSLGLRDQQGLDVSPIHPSTRSSRSVVTQRVRRRQWNEITVLEFNDLRKYQKTPIQEIKIRQITTP